MESESPDFECFSGIWDESTKGCKCQDNYFGRTCDKLIFRMEKDVLEKQFYLKPYGAFYFMEDLREGEKEIHFEIKSPENPKMDVLVNEGPSENNALFMRRKKNAKDSIFLDLTKLAFGEVDKTIVAEENWVYFTFYNHEDKKISVQFKIESKLYQFFNYF